MERAKLSKDSLKILFDALEENGHNMNTLAILLGFHPRTVRDWRSGRFTIPTDTLDILVGVANINPESLIIQILPTWWQTSRAGKIGGRAYFAKYGVLGTVDSRSFAGYMSYNRRKSIEGDIFHKKDIIKPDESCELAEFIGIMIGDGHVNEYQASVALDIKTDIEYCKFVVDTIRNLFRIEPTLQRRPKSGCINVVVSSVKFTDLLVALGLPRGDKIKGGLDVPDWISDNLDYSIACLRGIFDTDGSIFQEVHRVKDKIYAYPRMTFTSYSEPLRESIYRILSEVEVSVKMRSDRNVNVERFTDIDKYFRIIGSSNPKHIRRFVAFGGVG